MFLRDFIDFCAVDAFADAIRECTDAIRGRGEELVDVAE